MLSRASCAVCGGPLTVHQEVRDGVCDGIDCRRAVVQREIARRLGSIEVSRRELAGRLRDRIAAERGVSRTSLPVAIVPTFRAPVAPLPVSRRKRFLRHLIKLTRNVFTAGNDLAAAAGAREAGLADGVGAPAETVGRERTGEHSSEAPASWRQASSTAEAPGVTEIERTAHAAHNGESPGESGVADLEKNACATCRGFCCRLGQDHAFLDFASIRAVADRHPGMTEREVRRAYARALPDVAYLDGCVFQGPAGCVLDRDMRSWVCNEFQCLDLKALLTDETLARGSGILLVAVDGDGISRHALT